MEKTFEDFLTDWFFKLSQPITKDNFEDEYDKWLSELEGEDFIRYANLWGQEQFLRGQAKVLDKIK